MLREIFLEQLQNVCGQNTTISGLSLVFMSVLLKLLQILIYLFQIYSGM